MKKDYKFWFVIGSQFLYGEETLKQVEEDSLIITKGLNDSGLLPYEIIYKDTVKTSDGAERIIRDANYDETCAGIITFCHTFSPSKMWVNALSSLQKPWLHFHTQFNRTIPDNEIDMDYMNLHQGAHGDREHGFIGARLRKPRKVIMGYWQDAEIQKRIADWMKVAAGVAFSKELKVMRFGDNMREVAVTEGDKVEVQLKLGWEVNTWPVGELSQCIDAVTEEEIDEKMAEYKALYDFATDDIETVRYQAREEIAMLSMMKRENCGAFCNTFQDLWGMKQLPGLASQNMMAHGIGYGAEGDWKTAALCAVMKLMGEHSVFMEDYTYDLENGISLGSHMLEVCPMAAAEKPRIEVHPLGIGDREDPARLVFEGKAGKAIVASLIDMGGRLRLIVQDIECIKPTQKMPNLPVARVMWKPEPDLQTGAECWIIAGGAHHTVLSYDVTAEMMRDFANIMGIEYVHIDRDTTPAKLEDELFLKDIAWKLR